MTWAEKYLRKWGLTTNGTAHGTALQRKPVLSTAISGLLSFLGIAAVSSLHYATDLTGLIASFGATAVLLYDAIDSPLAQPRNLIGGHVLSALVGCTVHLLLGAYAPWLSCALAVSLSIMLMDVTKTLHPPGGATALVAVMGQESVHELGFAYVLSPVLLGAVIMCAVAVLGNNLFGSRRYPQRWI